MADIFGNTQPPAWLQRLTQPSEPGMLGKIFGDLVGGVATASDLAIQKASDKQSQGIETNWIKELPGSFKEGFAESRLNAVNPMWKIQAQEAQLRIAGEKLNLDSKQQAINMQKNQMAQWEQDAPKLSAWMSLPYDEILKTPIDVSSAQAIGIVEKTKAGAARLSYGATQNKLVSDYAAGLAEVDDPALQAQLMPGQDGKPTPQQVFGLDRYLKSKGKPGIGQKPEPSTAAIRNADAMARLQDEVDAATLAGDNEAAQSAQQRLDFLKSESKGGMDSLYAKPPEIIEQDGHKFLKWGKQLRSLDNSSAKEKAEISIITDKIKKLQDAIIKDPDNMDLKNALSASRKQFNSLFQSKPAVPTNAPAAPNKVLKYDPSTDSLK